MNSVPHPEKFLARIEKRGEDECWLWTGVHKNNGYGCLTVGIGCGRTQTIHAHRAAFVIFNKTGIPFGYHVCHSCDHPDCCNPAHLFLGTRSDNMRDMHAKGRGRKNYPLGRTPTNARAISAVGVVYASATAAGRAFGITKQGAIQRARRGIKGWAFA